MIKGFKFVDGEGDEYEGVQFSNGMIVVVVEDNQVFDYDDFQEFSEIYEPTKVVWQENDAINSNGGAVFKGGSLNIQGGSMVFGANSTVNVKRG